MKIKVTPDFPAADLVLLRHRLANAVARIALFDAEAAIAAEFGADDDDPDPIGEAMAGAVFDHVRESTIRAMLALHECEFANGADDLTSRQVQPLLAAGLASWRPTGILGVDEAVMRAAGVGGSGFDYASRWN